MSFALRQIAQPDFVVNVTTNYDLFKNHQANRKINRLNLSRLVKSMEQRTLISPILVNEDMVIIDGQHRLEALRLLQKPVYYIVIHGYGLPEMQLLNSVGKNWNGRDFMEMYADMGNEHYIKLREFRERFGWGQNECTSALTRMNCDGGANTRDIKNGLFKVVDYDWAISAAEKIEKIKPFYDGYKRRRFIFAMLQLFKNSNYNHDTFLQKLQYQSTSLVDCVSTEKYIALIEEIYNYKNRVKVSLRY
jgi:hypothetical protein